MKEIYYPCDAALKISVLTSRLQSNRDYKFKVINKKVRIIIW